MAYQSISTPRVDRLVCSNDPIDDSWTSQLSAFQTDCRRLALLLDDAKTANHIALEDAFRDWMAPLVPQGPTLVLSFVEGVIDLAVMPSPDAGTSQTPD